MELDPIELSDEDIDVIRATQGPMAVRCDAYVPAAEKLGVPVDEVLRRLESLRERGGLRRVAAILYHRRAGFSANGMGVWAVPDGEILDTGRRMAAFRGISHCYQRPTYADWPYSVFTMAHGRSKEECDAVLDAIAEQTGHRAARDAVLEHRVQEGPDALFHRRLQALGRGARVLSTSLPLRHPLRGALPARAARAAGRRQLAGAGDARDRPRPDLRRARLRRRAHRRRRQHLRRLRLLLGAADPRPRASRGDRCRDRGRGARHVVRRADGRRGRAGRARQRPDAVGRHAAHDLVRAPRRR